MFNYFDILSFIAISIAGYLGYLLGMFIGLYLLVVSGVIIVLVETVFSLEKIKAYIVLFISTIVISIISVSFFGFIFSDFFKRTAIRRLNRILGAVVGMACMLILFRTVMLPMSLQVSEDFHQAMTTSYTMNNLAPLVEGVFPGVQETIWNGVDNFLKSLSPAPPPEEALPDGKNDGEKPGKNPVLRIKKTAPSPEKLWDSPGE